MAAPSQDVGLSPGGAGESSRRCLLLPSLSILAQPSSSKVGESSDDKKHHKLLEHYHEVRTTLCASRLHADMLRGDLVAARAALVMALQEAA